MNSSCPNCQKKDWREGDNLVLFKQEIKSGEGSAGRMILKPWICRSCGMTLMTFAGEDEITFGKISREGS